MIFLFYHILTFLVFLNYQLNKLGQTYRLQKMRRYLMILRYYDLRNFDQNFHQKALDLVFDLIYN